MKTIIVVYTGSIVDKKTIGRMKKYSFNTQSDISVGDLLDSPEYDTPMQVVRVLETGFKYFNRSTGELSDDYTSTSQWEIRELVLRENDNEVIYASKVKLDK